MKTKNTLFSTLEKTIQQIDLSSVTADRKLILQSLIDVIQQKVTNNESVNLNFICTHNSRRSHLTQIWAKTMAYYFNIPKVTSYSGGTEATALFPKVIEVLNNCGFEVSKLSQETNSVYSIKYAENELPIIGFSKKTNDNFNPKSAFIAIMTCDSANEACPIVSGAETRISILYKDPKAYDNTPQQDEKYNERSSQIATEMYYVFSQLKQ